MKSPESHLTHSYVTLTQELRQHLDNVVIISINALENHAYLLCLLTEQLICIGMF